MTPCLTTKYRWNRGGRHHRGSPPRFQSGLASVDDELARYREELTAELEARLAQFKAEVEKGFTESLSRASAEHAEKLRAVREVPEGFSIRAVHRILDRFNNW